MRILFICLSGLKFDVNTPYSQPLGGTESAIAYLAPELVKLGHDVTLMCGTPEHMALGVKHLPVAEDLTAINPDVIIAASAPGAAPGIRKAAPWAKLILWNHMMPDQAALQPIFNPDTLKSIDRIVYVSQKQQDAFVQAASRNNLDMAGKVINNAVAPCFENMFSSAEEILEVKKCRGVYTSTPFRGLAVLAQIKELPISVYSSMAVYQSDDAPFATMFENLKTNDCLDMKGSVSQKDLVQAMREIAFLVYPSIFAECDSIAVREAMAAGLKVITTDSASPQTEYIDSMSAHGTIDDYGKMLRRNINSFRAHPEEWAAKMWEQVQHVNREYTWAKRALEWDKYLKTTVAA